MPYYRIKIWTKQQKKPFEGIRWVDNFSVDNVYRMYETKARAKFTGDFIDIEVQQLSKLCTAVVSHLENSEREKKKTAHINSAEGKIVDINRYQ